MAVITRTTVELAKPVVHLAVDPPLVPRALRPVAWPGHAERLLDHIDLTGLVRRHLDVNALVKEVDVDAITDRIDISRLIDRLDLNEITADLLEHTDLGELLRESTGVIGSEAVRGVRMQGIRADDALDRVISRLRHPRARAPVPISTEPAPAAPT